MPIVDGDRQWSDQGGNNQVEDGAGQDSSQRIGDRDRAESALNAKNKVMEYTTLKTNAAGIGMS